MILLNDNPHLKSVTYTSDIICMRIHRKKIAYKSQVRKSLQVIIMGLRREDIRV